MKKTTAFLILTISIFLMFLIFSANMPFEAFLFTASAFFISVILYLIVFFIESKERTPEN